jgi:curli biogenesis system outer membrane secretion channel CsgG
MGQFRLFAHLTLIANVVLACGTAVCLTSCGGTRIQIQATLPATKVDLASQGVKRIAIGDLLDETRHINPDHAILGDDLRAALVNLGRFEILDRSAVESLVKEHQFNDSGLVDQQSTATSGKFTGAVALILGTVTAYGYKEETKTMQSKSGAGYLIIGKGTIQATFKLIDIEHGRLIAVASCSISNTVQSPAKDFMGNDQYSINAQPSRPDGNALMTQLRAAVVLQFVRQISPTPFTDQVTLEEDSDTPEVASGNQSAALGEWADAKTQYQKATEKAPMKTAGFYNLGIADRATGDFPGAIEAFKKAYKISNQQVYLKEIEKTKQFAAGAAQQ